MILLQDYTFPEEVAFPLGGNDRPFKIMLEVHYDNPGMVNNNTIHTCLPCHVPVAQELLIVLVSSSSIRSRNQSMRQEGYP